MNYTSFYRLKRALQLLLILGLKVSQLKALGGRSEERHGVGGVL